MPPADLHRAFDTDWWMESARIIAGLARIVRGVGLADELAQDALVAALEHWPHRAYPTSRPRGSWQRRKTVPSINTAETTGPRAQA